MVFIRNITSKLEKYSFDYEMLQVFYAIDGKKTVAAIAKDLDKSVTQMKPKFDKLHQQHLILLAPRDVAGISESQESESSIPEPMPAPQEHDSETLDPPVIDSVSDLGGEEIEDIVGKEIEDMDELISELTRLSGEEFSVEKPSGISQVVGTVAADESELVWVDDLSVEQSEKNTAESSAQSDMVTEPVESRQPAENESESPSDHELEDDPFEYMDWTEPEQKNSTSDLFSIAKRLSESTDTPFNTFSLSRSSDENMNGFFAKPSKTPDSSFPSFSGRKTEEDEPETPPVNQHAIEHFENGLDALQRKVYDEALLHFELASELDPQNRLYKANIQRIKTIIESGD